MIEEEPMEASPMPFRCSICKHDFASKYLLKKHAKDCYETTEEQIHEDEEGGKKKCDHCGGSFALQGGWLTKHMKSCQQQCTHGMATSMFWCDFMAGWVGGKIFKTYNWVSWFQSCDFSGCAGLLVGHPFDTLKVIVLSLRSIFQVLETTSFKAKAGVTKLHTYRLTLH